MKKINLENVFINIGKFVLSFLISDFVIYCISFFIDDDILISHKILEYVFPCISFIIVFAISFVIKPKFDTSFLVAILIMWLLMTFVCWEHYNIPDSFFMFIMFSSSYLQGIHDILINDFLGIILAFGIPVIYIISFSLGAFVRKNINK